jgi:putative spermidine/putrescine transport system substrate-binding protein
MKLRKAFLAILLVTVLSLLVVACSSNTSNPSQKTDHVVIGVYGGNWETSIRKAALDQFQKETGIKVDVVSGADAEWFAKLRASNGNNPMYDLLILQPDTIQRAISAKLLQPLDSKNIPNLKDLSPSVQKKLSKGNQSYAAGFSMGQLGIAYRKDLVPVEPKKWTDLWNPAYKGHVAISSPTYSAGLQFFSGLIHALGGKETNEADVNQAFQKLGQLKSSVVAYPDNPGSIQTLLERGDAWVVPFWDGRAFAMQQANSNIGFVYPEDGSVAAAASFAITKGSPNLANAYKLLNYLLQPKVQKAFAEENFYGMTNKNVQYSDNLKKKIKTGEEVYNQLTWVDYRVATPKLADWTNRWSQIMGDRK